MVLWDYDSTRERIELSLDRAEWDPGGCAILFIYVSSVST